MAYVIYSPQACDWRGGTLVDITYPWPARVPLSCRLVAGSVDLPCYGAEEGQGASLYPRGPKQRVVTPRLPSGTDAEGQLVFADADGNEILRLAMRVAPPFYPTSTYTLRALCPAVWAAGPRAIDQEAPLP